MRYMHSGFAVLMIGVLLSQVPSRAQSEWAGGAKTDYGMLKMDQARYNEWLSRWERYIINGARNRYCDKEMGEEVG
jgi:hypothetical protein